MLHASSRASPLHLLIGLFMESAGLWRALASEWFSPGKLEEPARILLVPMTNHSLVYVDFGEGSERYAPPCGHALHRRPQLPRLRAEEEEELLRIRQELSLLARRRRRWSTVAKRRR